MSVQNMQIRSYQIIILMEQQHIYKLHLKFKTSNGPLQQWCRIILQVATIQNRHILWKYLKIHISINGLDPEMFLRRCMCQTHPIYLDFKSQFVVSSREDVMKLSFHQQFLNVKCKMVFYSQIKFLFQPNYLEYHWFQLFVEFWFHLSSSF